MGLDTNRSEQDKSEMSSQVQTLLHHSNECTKSTMFAKTAVFTVVLHKWVKYLQLAGTGVVTLQGHICTVSKEC